MSSAGPCITNVFATRRKNFSQWHRSFQRKLLSHWLKFLRHVAITLVIQGPGPPRRCVKGRHICWFWGPKINKIPCTQIWWTLFLVRLYCQHYEQHLSVFLMVASLSSGWTKLVKSTKPQQNTIGHGSTIRVTVPLLSTGN